MGVTRYDTLNAIGASAKYVAAIPTSPYDYYGGTSGQNPEVSEWAGGELAFLSTDSRLYIQTATSGITASWRRLADAFATTTSTSTTSSSSSSSSTTTSSSSTSTTTSTSTSSSTSTSTSTSTTTPA